jgi:hypothetical protein
MDDKIKIEVESDQNEEKVMSEHDNEEDKQDGMCISYITTLFII